MKIGDEWGAVNAGLIREHFRQFLAECDKKGITNDVLLRRTSRADQIVGRIAPHWREESDAIALQAGIDPELYNAYLLGKYRGVAFQECTSYAAVGEATGDGRTLFHKNRDNVERPQAGYIKKTRVPGRSIFGFVATGDVSDTGVMMMVNERGLAGSADVGASDPDWFGMGLTNPYGLRHIAETASTCREALEIVEWMTRDRLYAGGPVHTNWLFADATGMALRVVNANESIVSRESTQSGILLNVEREGLRPLLQENSGRIDARLMMRAARLPSVSMASTLCGLTAEVDWERPDRRTCAWIALGRPSDSPFVGVSMAAEETPQEMLDGMLFCLGRARGARPEQFRRIEEDGMAAIREWKESGAESAGRANELFVEWAAAARHALTAIPSGRSPY